MGIGLKHVGLQISPHHQFNDIIFDAPFYEMRDPRMPKNMESNLSFDSGYSANVPNLPQHMIMG